MNLQENIQRIKEMMKILSEDSSNNLEVIKSNLNINNVNTEKTHISAILQLKYNVDYILNFYVKVDGKYYDKETYENLKDGETIKDVSKLVGLVAYFKSNMESVKFDAEKNKKWDGECVNVYNEIINKLNTFFEPNIFEKTPIGHSEKGWDYYTGTHCKKMNPKSPGCQSRN